SSPASASTIIFAARTTPSQGIHDSITAPGFSSPLVVGVRVSSFVTCRVWDERSESFPSPSGRGRPVCGAGEGVWRDPSFRETPGALTRASRGLSQRARQWFAALTYGNETGHERGD